MLTLSHLRKPPKVYLLLVSIITAVAGIDQISKTYIVRSLKLYESTVVIGHFFSLTHTRNPGAAFGLLAEEGGSFRIYFFLGISIIALFFLIYYFIMTPAEETLSLVALSLIMGGAVGNFVDRIQKGEVIDFLDFYIGRYHWWIFNLADSAITIGISILILQTLFKKSGSDALHINL